MTGLGDKSVQIANAGLNTAQKIMDEAKTTQDQSLANETKTRDEIARMFL